ERNRSRKASKNSYENLTRKARRRGRPGLIEQEFGLKSPALSFLNPFKRSPPSGPCLDDLLKGGEVKMSAGLYCLESLFGVDRHQFPKTLPCSRRGRQVFYDLRAVINCMLSLLDGSTPGRRWLPEVVL